MSIHKVSCNTAIQISISPIENDTQSAPQPEDSSQFLGRKIRHHQRSTPEIFPVDSINNALSQNNALSKMRTRTTSARCLNQIEIISTPESKKDDSSLTPQEPTLRIQNSHSQKFPGEKKYRRSVSTTLDIETLIRANKTDMIFTLISSGAFSIEEDQQKVALPLKKIQMIFDTFQATDREADLIEFIVASFRHDLPKDNSKPPLRSNEPSLLFFKEFCNRYIPGLFGKKGLVSGIIKKLKKQHKKPEWKQLDDLLRDRPFKSNSDFRDITNNAHEFTLKRFQSICAFSLKNAHPACKILWGKLDQLFYEFYANMPEKTSSSDMSDEMSNERSENAPQQQAKALLASLFFFRLICGELYPVMNHEKCPSSLRALCLMLQKAFTNISCRTTPLQQNLSYIKTLLATTEPLFNSFLEEMTAGV